MSKTTIKDLSFYDKEVLLVFVRGKPTKLREVEKRLGEIHAGGTFDALVRCFGIKQRSLVTSITNLQRLGFLHVILHQDGQVSYLLSSHGKKILGY